METVVADSVSPRWFIPEGTCVDVVAQAFRPAGAADGRAKALRYLNGATSTQVVSGIKI